MHGVVVRAQHRAEDAAGVVADAAQEARLRPVAAPVVRQADASAVPQPHARHIQRRRLRMRTDPRAADAVVHVAAGVGAEVVDLDHVGTQKFPSRRLQRLPPPDADRQGEPAGHLGLGRAHPRHRAHVGSQQTCLDLMAGLAVDPVGLGAEVDPRRGEFSDAARELGALPEHGRACASVDRPVDQPADEGRFGPAGRIGRRAGPRGGRQHGTAGRQRPAECGQEEGRQGSGAQHHNGTLADSLMPRLHDAASMRKGRPLRSRP